MRWALLPYRRYFEFRGRSRRTEYWAFALGWAAAFFVLGWFGRISAELSDFFELMRGLFVLGTFIPGLGVTVRRLHDLNRTGWWASLPFVPLLLVFGTVLFNGELPDAMAIWAGFALMLCPGALLAAMAWKGAAGVNRFGEDPRNPGADLETVFG